MPKEGEGSLRKGEGLNENSKKGKGERYCKGGGAFKRGRGGCDPLLYYDIKLVENKTMPIIKWL